MKFCSANTEDKTGAQLLDDGAGKARAVLFKLLEELALLFPDEVLHVGGDETQYVGNCTKENTIGLEKAVLARVKTLRNSSAESMVDSIKEFTEPPGNLHAARPSSISSISIVSPSEGTFNYHLL